MRLQIHFIDSSILEKDSNNSNNNNNTSLNDDTTIIDTTFIDHCKNSIISRLFERFSTIVSLDDPYKCNNHFKCKISNITFLKNQEEQLHTSNSIVKNNTRDDNIREYNTSNDSNNTTTTNTTKSKNDTSKNDMENEDLTLIKNSYLTFHYKHDIITSNTIDQINNHIDKNLLILITLLLKNILEIKDYDVFNENGKCEINSHHKNTIQSIRSELDMDELSIKDVYSHLHDIESTLRSYKPILHLTFFIKEFISVDHNLNELNVYHLLKRVSIVFELNNLNQSNTQSLLEKHYILKDDIDYLSIHNNSNNTTSFTNTDNTNKSNKGDSLDENHIDPTILDENNTNNNTNNGDSNTLNTYSTTITTSTTSISTISKINEKKFLPLFENYTLLLKESEFKF